MDFLSARFYCFLVILLFLYYIFPVKKRWYILVAGSIVFYWEISGIGIVLLILWSMVSYGFGKLLYKYDSNKIILTFAVGVTLCPLVLSKCIDSMSMIKAVGLSFYTLQMVSYLIDIYRREIQPEKNFLKYFLFISFFPQIIQGPIPRFKQLIEQLYIGHRFDEKLFTKGLQLIVWGFFLKLMIADKTSVVVNTVFDNDAYGGIYIWIAGILYSIQLYTDFLSCVCLAQGAASLFGIQLMDNFAHPYFAKSIKEFWRRWHISLSTWLRDYVYISIGGSRQGKLRKHINLMITFVISGIWHGTGMKYIAWGVMHAIYQIAGDVTVDIRDAVYRKLHLDKDNIIRQSIQTVGTCFWVMIAWIMFRANSMRTGVYMILSMFELRNIHVMVDGSLFDLGMSGQDWIILLISIGILICVSKIQEQLCIRDQILCLHLPVRWMIYIIVVIVIMIFGSYGIDFNVQEFIYGGF